jgi:hypothetical protein
MNGAERNDYRLPMRSLRTYQERIAYRLEYHKLRQEWARQKGVTLPKVPQATGMGVEPGYVETSLGSWADKLTAFFGSNNLKCTKNSSYKTINK